MTLHGNSNHPVPHRMGPAVPPGPTVFRLDCPWQGRRLFWRHQHLYFALGKPSPYLEPLASR